MGLRVAVYGGSFSPFSNSHVAVVRHVADSDDFDRIVLVPSIAHVFKGRGFPYEHRFNMASTALENARLKVPAVVSMVEFYMLREQPGPIFTIQLLRNLQNSPPSHRTAELRFVVGPDVIAELDQWEYVEDIRREFGFYEVPVLGTHASEIREMLENGDPEWARHVPPRVADYIRMHDIYHVARTTCDHEWESTLIATFENPHLERCAKCYLPRPGSECESWHRAMAEREGRTP